MTKSFTVQNPLNFHTLKRNYCWCLIFKKKQNKTKQKKNLKDKWEAGLDLPVVLEGSPGKAGGDCGYLWEKVIGGKGFGNNNQNELPLGVAILKKIWLHPSGLRSPWPNNKLGGNTAPSNCKQAA